MIQLTYQPAFDAFHSAFRVLRLRQAILASIGELPRDHVRIIDFYLLFPFRSDAIRVKQHHRRFKKIAQKYKATQPYGDLPEDRILFNRMAPIQNAAMDTLAAKGFLAAEQYKRGFVASSDKATPSDVLKRVAQLNSDQHDLMEFMKALATEYELLGSNGLKVRTGLMDSAYDAI